MEINYGTLTSIIFLPGYPQHIIQRGNNRQATFFTDEDYKVYLDKLSLYADKHKVQIHAYVLMTNHVHLLLTAVDEWSFSKLMQSLGGTMCFILIKHTRNQ
ncbi:transposase [Amphritea japonica]|uniref:transposase n=1 Tax=Amphritea japonica TaxID=452627 RepID=UPI0003A3544A|nr:transposase [Amphritea japonica]